jgi:hypothetical protein
VLVDHYVQTEDLEVARTPFWVDEVGARVDYVGRDAPDLG